MNRKIKFRGKPMTLDGKTCSDWVYGYNIWQGITEPTICEINHTPVNPDTVGQYTGFDVNGVEIYEGDIVYVPETEFNGELKGEVIFDKGGWIVKSLRSDWGSELAWVLRIDHELHRPVRPAQVVGNIFDMEQFSLS